MKSNHFNFTPPLPRHRLIAHRGLPTRAPENTLVSFQLAIKEQISWMEFDVQLTSDHVLMIIHDDDLHRTTNGQGYVHEKTSDYLNTLDAGSWFDPKFSGERIPLFAPTITELLKTDIFLNIELKLPQHPPVGHAALFALVFSQTMHSLWPVAHPKPLLSSFEWSLLEAVRSSLPSYPIGYLSDVCSEKIIDRVAQQHNASLHCPYQVLTPELLHYAYNKRVPVLAFTVNDPLTASRLIKEGIFAIFSDDATQLIKEIPSTL
jgi:glycerophosphoryl diester phosphodiesterase